MQRNGQIVSSWGHARGDGVANGTFMDSLMLSMAQKNTPELRGSCDEPDQLDVLYEENHFKTFSFLTYLERFTQLKLAIVFFQMFCF